MITCRILELDNTRTWQYWNLIILEVGSIYQNLIILELGSILELGNTRSWQYTRT